MLNKPLKYHDIVVTQVEVITQYSGQGRPKKDAKPTVIGYKLPTQLLANTPKIAMLRSQQGRFILATNQLDTNSLSDQEMLLAYKEQHHKTEQAFRFIKGNAFEVSSVFLKKESRIQALMMVMTLCLMVYSFSELWLRKSLKEHNESILNQLKKPTQQPTMMWVCRLFHGIHELHLQFEGYRKQYVINLKNVTKQIIGYFGPKAMAIYGLKMGI